MPALLATDHSVTKCTLHLKKMYLPLLGQTFFGLFHFVYCLMLVSDQKCRIYTTGAKAVHLIPHPLHPLAVQELTSRTTGH